MTLASGHPHEAVEAKGHDRSQLIHGVCLVFVTGPRMSAGLPSPPRPCVQHLPAKVELPLARLRGKDSLPPTSVHTVHMPTRADRCEAWPMVGQIMFAGVVFKQPEPQDISGLQS